MWNAESLLHCGLTWPGVQRAQEMKCDICTKENAVLKAFHSSSPIAIIFLPCPSLQLIVAFNTILRQAIHNDNSIISIFNSSSNP
jgi:hypothetical protein